MQPHETSGLVDVPLNRLRRSPDNVRKTYPGAGLESLAASILARGLLQNLVGYVAEDGWVEVTGGGRRLAALELLTERGAVPEDQPVKVCLRPRDWAVEDSLVENEARVPMSPYDAFIAYATLARQGATEDEIAERFGVPVRTVRQRMRLGRVSPRILELYRDGKISLDTVEAFAVVDDPEQQERVLGQLGSGSLHAYYVRSALLGEKVSATSKLGRFVRAEYGRRGLPVTTDLFARESDEGTLLDDKAAAIGVAEELLRAEADRLVTDEGWAWAEPSIDFPGFAGFVRLSPDETTPLPAETQARLDTLLKERAALAGEDEGAEAAGAAFAWEDGEDGSDDGADDPVEARIDALDAEIAAIEDAQQPRHSAEARGRSGCFVVIGYDGTLDVRTGYVRREDAEPGTVAQHGLGAGQPAAKGLYSKVLAADLAAHRTQALRVALARSPALALSYLAYVLVVKVARLGYVHTASNLTASTAPLSSGVGLDLDATPAAVALRDIVGEFSEVLGDKKGLDLFDAIRALPPGDRDRLIAALFARTIATGLGLAAEKPDPVVESLGALAGTDVAAFFRPSGQEFFGRVPRQFILDELSCIGGVRQIASRRKAEVVATLDRWFRDPAAIRRSEIGPVEADADGAVDAETAQRIASWLPPGMAFVAPGEDEPEAKAA